ncbi:hypothetical protein HP15_980 [Marinobacter adhaerens HP15]|uniref:Uncharacterized protein n=1 Tax=Marinobacter adhaerens (strain DSM 23420 / HP15) TaxID=225937 RepID=E4PFJ5_MARAH|nr:hypothetical protein HP15_980 [Marinobacter adhaerens HP15]
MVHQLRAALLCSASSTKGESVHQSAAEWIVSLLRERNIPFLICGGLAARGYGSQRDLHDIDLFVPGEHFLSVVQAGQPFVSKAAAHRQEEGWDLPTSSSNMRVSKWKWVTPTVHKSLMLATRPGFRSI